MRAVVFAYHLMGCRGLQALIDAGFEVVAVFTHADDPNENTWFPSVAELATEHGIPVYAPKDVNHPLWVQRIQEMAPDMMFSFYYRNLLGKPLLALPARGSFNLHGSLLPRYRGRCPVNWVLVNGESKTGVSLHEMTSTPDGGDLIDQEPVPIHDDDGAYELSLRCADAAVVLLERALPRLLAGTATRTAQDASLATTFGGRRPADGEILWQRAAREIRNLVRAVAKPWPGAFTMVGERKLLIWKASKVDLPGEAKEPGVVCSTEPLVIQTGDGGLRVDLAQWQDGIPVHGTQLARDSHLVVGMAVGRRSIPARRVKPTRVLILGVNGFIGSALSERLLESGKFEVHGMDLHRNNIAHLFDREGFTFTEGDISIHREWIEYHVRKCDVVLPLVAIATPIEYTRNPLRVFELDFEENLKVVRYCAKYGKRIVFPSTSEVYGLCDEEVFDEDHSRLVLGPIHKQRWIYSCIKQLLDRVIWAYGTQQNLRFTLFRPFNWIGPRLDSLDAARIGSSRAITQLILNLVEGTPIQLIDGGHQKRCFTDLSEGVECLYRLIENAGDQCDRQIVNIGNPNNEASIRQLAEMLVQKFEAHPLRHLFPPFAGYRELESESYYGQGYEDVQHRRPSIRNAKRLVGWVPVVGLEEAVDRTLDYFLQDFVAAHRPAEPGTPSSEENASASHGQSGAGGVGIGRASVR